MKGGGWGGGEEERGVLREGVKRMRERWVKRG